MRAKDFLMGLAVLAGFSATVTAQAPVGPYTVGVGESEQGGERHAARHMWYSEVKANSRHWDLWANYCCEKRREHDPVRHYHPLVQMKCSLLPGLCGCGHAYGGQCAGKCDSGVESGKGGHSYHHHHAGSMEVQSDALDRPLLAQPPAPPVVVDPQQSRGDTDTDPKPLTPRPRSGTDHASSEPGSSRPGAATEDQPPQPIELAPEQAPIVVPPTTPATPRRVPRNPLPKRSVNPPVPPTPNAAPPRDTSPAGSVSRRPNAKPVSVNLGKYIQTK